jgi:hypothetical protein
MIVILLDDIVAGCVPLRDSLNMTKERNFTEF